jgi:excinuclease ABC subunit A
LRGVATHNLRDLDVDLPADGLTVVTGVSGSGKSSLVFDTLFGESRARITEHLSGYLQRQLGAGGVRARSLREASGLRPAIALRQRAEAETSADRRATVATAAELHPTLRTVWSRCTDAGLPAAAFSFFRKEGACETCAGLGTVRRCDPELLIDDAAMPLFDGALRAKNKVVRDFGDPGMRHRSLLEAVARARGFDLSRPWRELDAEAQRAVLLGAGDEQFDAVWEHDGAEGDVHRWRAGWPGIAPAIDQEHARRLASGSKTRRADFEELLAEATCPVCEGARLQQASRQLRVAGITLPELCRRSVSEFGAWIAAASLSAREREFAADAFGELLRRVERLTSLGLGHLQLDRSMASLSAGERQRVRLARQLAAPLTDCVYVLDEPTLGLHPSDVDALLAAIRGLVDAGNAVVAVEHDLRVAEAAQHVIEIGPGAGRDGGRVVASAPPAAMPASSRTGRRLQQPRPALRSTPRRPSSGRIEISGAHANHLEDLDVALPIGQLTVVCGVSGSGKSSLLGGVVARSAKAGVAIGCRSIAGLDAFAHVVVDAAARARRSRTSCVATLLGGFDELRKQFAATDAARANGWRAAHFSLHGRSGGACRACSGVGWVRSEFDFLGAGQWLPCDTCEGRRFDDATLAIRWRGLDLAQCLAATVDELLLSLPPRGLARLRGPLQVAADLGLGYLTLGQAGDSLSGGEAQRLSLATHLAAAGDGATLFVLDEPTRGLHPDDVDALRVAFDQLLERGHTILAVEHDLSVIADADHVVELGPGAGADGGCVVVHGTPSDVARCESSRTGSALRDN